MYVVNFYVLEKSGLVTYDLRCHLSVGVLKIEPTRVPKLIIPLQESTLSE